MTMRGRPDTVAMIVPGFTLSPTATSTRVMTARSVPGGTDAASPTDVPEVKFPGTMSVLAKLLRSTVAVTGMGVLMESRAADWGDLT
ncbi:hypothetical protein StoSoilB5_09070 [Arthrobacter sp. StoSoilB5]|nr:hypothetical protein StoSoilB5_09070 [Arthrobacter sp. StoSoilB5]